MITLECSMGYLYYSKTRPFAEYKTCFSFSSADFNFHISLYVPRIFQPHRLISFSSKNYPNGRLINFARTHVYSKIHNNPDSLHRDMKALKAIDSLTSVFTKLKVKDWFEQDFTGISKNFQLCFIVIRECEGYISGLSSEFRKNVDCQNSLRDITLYRLEQSLKFHDLQSEHHTLLDLLKGIIC